MLAIDHEPREFYAWENQMSRAQIDRTWSACSDLKLHKSPEFTSAVDVYLAAEEV